MEMGLKQEKCQADIIICIHNALEDVKECLNSVLENTIFPYSLILINDGSNSETTRFLEQFAAQEKVTLISNENARGYTFAANQGLQKSNSSYAVLLNSDTVVTPHWLERMIACAESKENIGIVGPLSNTASWQSIPKLSENADWAENRLPEGISISEMGNIVFEKSPKFYPEIPFINGFCLLIKRAVIEDIGLFDEDNFGKGYGEEDDFCIRARQQGWNLVVADDVYIYHKQSRSYSDARRKQLSKIARNKLISKYGEEYLQENVRFCIHNPYLAQLRSWFQVIFDRLSITKEVKEKWSGKKAIFVVSENSINEKLKVIIQEAFTMRVMGLDVKLITLRQNKKEIENYCESRNYSLPVLDLTQEELLDVLAADVGIATSSNALNWLNANKKSPLKTAFYIFEFEPFYLKKGTIEYRNLIEIYQQTEAVFITKSKINQKLVKDFTGKICSLIAPSVMIPQQQCIAPKFQLTTPSLNIAIFMSPFHHLVQVENLLTDISKIYRSAFKINWIFIQEHTLKITNKRIAGETKQELSQSEKIDIYVDLSTYQPIGLYGLEAMLNGAAVILPKYGIGKEFIKHKRNGWLVDTRSYNECFLALKKLIGDSSKRKLVQQRAQVESYLFSTENAVYNILKAVIQ